MRHTSEVTKWGSRCLLCLVLGILVAGSAIRGTLTAQAVGQTGGTKAAVRSWRLRLQLDSGEVRIAVSDELATLAVTAPSGSFQLAFDDSDPLAQWALAAAILPVPALEPRPGGGTPRQFRFQSARLVQPGDTATRSTDTEFSLTRVSADTADAYMLSGTNGAWTFAFPLSRARADDLFAALEGVQMPGVARFDPPQRGRTPAEDTPDVSGAYVEADRLDRGAQFLNRSPRPTYPEELYDTGIKGTVRLLYVVDTTGTVRPQSIRLIGRAHPLLALSARAALLKASFRPAELGGRFVAQLVTQDFVFTAQ